PIATPLLPLTCAPAPIAVDAELGAVEPQPIAVLCTPAEGLVQLTVLVRTPLPITVCPNATCGATIPATTTTPITPPPPSAPIPSRSRFSPSTRCARRNIAISRRRWAQPMPCTPGIQPPRKPVSVEPLFFR